MRQAKRTFAGNHTSPVQDFHDPIGQHFELRAEPGCTHAKYLELLGQKYPPNECRYSSYSFSPLRVQTADSSLRILIASAFLLPGRAHTEPKAEHRYPTVISNQAYLLSHR